MNKLIQSTRHSTLTVGDLALCAGHVHAAVGSWWLRTGPVFVDFKNDVTLKAPLLGGETTGSGA